MSTATRLGLHILLLSLLAGCAPTGLIYSNTVYPYSKRFDATKVGSKSCVIDAHQVKEPVSGYNLYAEWTTRFIAAEAKKAGINQVHYIDKKVLSLLNGVYKRESLIIYGD